MNDCSFPLRGPEFESMVENFVDPNQVDWGATDTKKMTEKEKQEIRKQGLVGEAYRLPQ